MPDELEVFLKEHRRRQNPYNDFIEDSAERHNVDPDMVRAMMHQESSNKKGAVSHKGASGLMQLMPATAQRLGVKNIFDPKENIEGGTKYARRLLDMFGGNVELALAGYNAGEGAVQKYGNKVPPYRETQDYVKRIRGNYQGKGYKRDPLEQFIQKSRPAIDTSTLKPTTSLEDFVEDFRKQNPITSPTFPTAQPLASPPPAGALTDAGYQSRPVQQAVTETDDTIQSQINSALDDKVKTRYGVLTTSTEQNGQLFNAGFKAFPVGNEMLWLNVPKILKNKKLGIKDEKHLRQYVEKNGEKALTQFIGIAKPVDDTSNGVAVTAETNGVENASAVVTDEKSAAKQVKNYNDQFPNAVKRVTTTDEIAAGRIGEHTREVEEVTPTQKRFNEWRVANNKPNDQTAVDEFNTLLKTESEQQQAEQVKTILAKNPAFAKFLTDKNLTYGQEAIDAYNASLPKNRGGGVKKQRVIPRRNGLPDTQPASTKYDEKEYQVYLESMRLTGRSPLSFADFVRTHPAKQAQSFTNIEGENEDGQEQRAPTGQGINDNTDLGTVTVNPKWSDEEKVRYALSKILPNYDVTPQEIEDWIAQAKGRLSDDPKALVLHPGDKTISDFTVRGRTLKQIKGEFKPSTPEEIVAREKKEAGMALTDDELRAKAKANIWDNPLSGGTDADIQAEYERLKRTELSSDEKASAVSVGDFIKTIMDAPMGGAFGSGGKEGQKIASGTISGLIESVGGRGSEFVSGLYRYSLPGLIQRGIGQVTGQEDFTADKITKFANQAKVVGVSAKGDGILYDVGNVGGNLAGDVPRLVGLTVLSGGNPVIAFGVDEFLRSAGRGETIGEQAKYAIKGAVLGAIFHGASRLGASVEEGLTTALLPKQSVLGLEKGYRPNVDIALVTKLAGESVRVGTIGTGTFATSKLEGASTKEALYNTALMLLTDLGFNHKKYGQMADMSGKVFRLWKNGEYKDFLVWLKESGAKTEVYDVTGKVSDNNIQAVLSDEMPAGIKNVTPRKPKGSLEGTVEYPQPKEALWKNAENDQPVKVVGEAGKLNGEIYYNIEGSKTAVPASEITFTTPATTITDAEPVYKGKDVAKAELPLVSPEENAAKVEEAKRQASTVTINGSGESSASQESINRAVSEKAQQITRVVVDTRSGKERPLIGTDAVDYQPQPFESVEFRGGDRNGEVIAQGGRVSPAYASPSRIEPVEPAAKGEVKPVGEPQGEGLRSYSPDEIQSHVDQTPITKKGDKFFVKDLWPGKDFASKEDAQKALTEYYSSRKQITDWRKAVDTTDDQMEASSIMRTIANKTDSDSEASDILDRLPDKYADRSHVAWSIINNPRLGEVVRRRAADLHDTFKMGGDGHAVIDRSLASSSKSSQTAATPPTPATTSSVPPVTEKVAAKEPWRMDTFAKPVAERGNRFEMLNDSGQVFDNLYHQSITPPKLDRAEAKAVMNRLNKSDFNNKDSGASVLKVEKNQYILEKTRQEKVEEALKEGRSVPPEILANYPDLAKKYATPSLPAAVATQQAEPPPLAMKGDVAKVEGVTRGVRRPVKVAEEGGAAKPPVEQAYSVEPAKRGLKNKFVVTTPSTTGTKTREARLVEAAGGRYSGVQGGYVVTESQLVKFKDYLAKGYDASAVTGKLYPEYVQKEAKTAKSDTSGETFQQPARQQTQTPEFKNWFGDSKAVDDKGEPLVVYHGTKADIAKFRRRVGDIGIHFGSAGQANDRLDYTRDRKATEGNENLVPVYLKIRNPIRLPDLGLWNAENINWKLTEIFPSDADRIRRLRSTKDVREYLQSKGYDGVIYRNTGEVEGSSAFMQKHDELSKALTESQKRRGRPLNAFDKDDQRTPAYIAWKQSYQDYSDFREKNATDSYIIFEPSQAKSAIGNRGTFDPNNANILQHLRQETEPMAAAVNQDVRVNLENAEYTADGSAITYRNTDAYGLTVQILEEALPDSKHNSFGVMLYGDQVQKVRDTIADLRKEFDADKEYYSKKVRAALSNFAKTFDKAAASSKAEFGMESVIFAMDDRALAEERTHQARVATVDAAANTVRATQSDEFWNEFDTDPFLKTIDKKLASTYRDKYLRRAEIIDKMMVGEFDALGLDPVKDASEIYRVLEMWHDDTVKKFGKFNARRYEKINEVTNYWLGRGLAAEGAIQTEKASEADGKAADSGVRDDRTAQEVSANAEAKGTATDAPAENAGVKPIVGKGVIGFDTPKQAKIKNRKFAETIAHNLMDIGDVPYETNTFIKATNDAFDLIEKKGIDGAIEKFRSMGNGEETFGNKTATAAAIMTDLYNEGSQKDLIEFGVEATKHVGTAAQELVMAKLMSRFSPVFASMHADGITLKKFGRMQSPQERDRTDNLAEKLKDTSDNLAVTRATIDVSEANAQQFEELERGYENLLKKEEQRRGDLETALSAAQEAIEYYKTLSENKPVKTTAARRKMRAEIVAEMPALLNTVKQAFKSATFQMPVARETEESDAATEALIKLGAVKLIDGLPKKLTLKQFDEYLDGLTDNGLTQAQKNYIHAKAFESIQTASPLSQEGRLILHNRMAHAQRAKLTIPKHDKTDQRAAQKEKVKSGEAYRDDQFAKTMLDTADVLNASDEAVLMAFGLRETPNLHTLRQVYKQAVPQGGNFDQALKDGKAIYEATKDLIQTARDESKYGKDTSKDEVVRMKRHEKDMRTAERLAQKELEHHFNKLNRSILSKVGHGVSDVWNITRAFLFSLDSGFMLAQGALPLVMNTKAWARSIKGITPAFEMPALKRWLGDEGIKTPAFLGQKYGSQQILSGAGLLKPGQGVTGALREFMPSIDRFLARRGFTNESFETAITKYYDSEIRKELESHGTKFEVIGNIADFNENFMSDIAKKFPGVRQTNLAHSLATDLMRLNIGKQIFGEVDDMYNRGKLTAFQANAAKDALARKWVNVITGKGYTPGAWHDIFRWLAQIGSAPSLALSSAQFLHYTLPISPRLYTLPKGARKIVAKGALRSYGILGGIFLTLGMLGLINRDPEDKDFGVIDMGKISPKLADQKLNIMRQLKEPVRLSLGLTLKKLYYMATGNKEGSARINDEWYEELVMNDFGGIGSFWKGKAHPSISYLNTLFTGKNFVGEPATTLDYIPVVPLGVKETVQSATYNKKENILKSGKAGQLDDNWSRMIASIVFNGIGWSANSYAGADTTTSQKQIVSMMTEDDRTEEEKAISRKANQYERLIREGFAKNDIEQDMTADLKAGNLDAESVKKLWAVYEDEMGNFQTKYKVWNLTDEQKRILMANRRAFKILDYVWGGEPYKMDWRKVDAALKFANAKENTLNDRAAQAIAEGIILEALLKSPKMSKQPDSPEIKALRDEHKALPPYEKQTDAQKERAKQLVEQINKLMKPKQ